MRGDRKTSSKSFHSIFDVHLFAIAISNSCDRISLTFSLVCLEHIALLFCDRSQWDYFSVVTYGLTAFVKFISAS
jgi:hypothetical protein